MIGADGCARNGAFGKEAEAKGYVEFEAHGIDADQQYDDADCEPADAVAACERAGEDEAEAGQEHRGENWKRERQHESDIEGDCGEKVDLRLPLGEGTFQQLPSANDEEAHDGDGGKNDDV